MSYPQGMSIGLLKHLADMLRDDDDEMPTENELTFDSTESDNDELNDDSVDSLNIPNYDESGITKENFHNLDTEKEQEEIISLACDYCEKVFDLKEELKSHNIGKKCSCNICSTKFCNEDDLNSHKIDKHKKIEFKCEFCGKEFEKRYILKRHLETRNMQACDICGLMLCNKTDINLHKKSEHKQEKFKCDYCEKEFDKKYNLKRHYDSRILQECHICGLVFCNHVELTRHLSSTHNHSKKIKK